MKPPVRNPALFLLVRGLLAVAALAACGGPATPEELPSVRLSYNEAIIRSSNEQLLLNLVRLRYLHAPQFFEVTAVTTQSSVTAGGSLGVGANLGNNLRLPEGAGVSTPIVTGSLGGSTSVSHRPTVSYAPLQGEAFAQRMVQPIRPATLFSLVNVGWRVDRLFACCVSRINDMSAPVIASTDPSFGGERFRRLGELLYELQIRGALEIGLLRVGAGQELRMTFVPVDDDPRIRALIGEAQGLLGLDPSLSSYRILSYHPPEVARPSSREAPVAEAEAPPEAETAEGEAEGGEPAPPPPPPPSVARPEPGGADHIVVRTRSLLGALFYLSHGVETPDGDPTARSLDYNGDDGQLISVGNPVPGSLVSVHASAGSPAEAYVRTSYRGTWYSIDDNNLEAKQTFLLLQILFSVLSASDGSAPLLTIPVGG